MGRGAARGMETLWPTISVRWPDARKSAGCACGNRSDSPGTILGARGVREADPWVLAVQVHVPDSVYYRTRTGQGVVCSA